MMLALALVVAVASSKPEEPPERPSRPAPVQRVAPPAPVQRAAPPSASAPEHEAPIRVMPPIRVVQPDPPVRVAAPISRATPQPVTRIPAPPNEPRRPYPSPTPAIASTQAPLVTTVYVNNDDDDRDRYRHDFYSPYDYNPYYTANYYPVYYPVFIFMPLVPGFCSSYNSCYESFGTPGSTGYTSSEVQGFILGQEGNTLIVFTPNQQMLFVNASYLLQAGYPRYRFAPGTFVDIAGYYYQNQFVAIGMF